jgi:hypothetical protein
VKDEQGNFINILICFGEQQSSEACEVKRTNLIVVSTSREGEKFSLQVYPVQTASFMAQFNLHDGVQYLPSDS